MKRRVAKLVSRILLFLLLGAILNVGVAWALVFMHDPTLNDGTEESYSRDGDSRYAYMDWRISRRRVRGSEVVVSSWSGPAGGTITMPGNSGEPETLVPKWAPELSACSKPSPVDSDTVGIARMDGWPAFTLRGRVICTDGVDLRGDEPVSTRDFQVRTAQVIRALPPNSLDVDELRFVPICPIWPGFAINTILYAAILWLPFAALGRFRRRRRIKRGLCPKCAYDLRGGNHAACPECGKAVKL